MSRQLDHAGIGGTSADDIVGRTRRGVFARLKDPHLNDHDRWVLHQFGRFLSGVAPEPDPRASRICTLEHAHRPGIGAQPR